MAKKKEYGDEAEDIDEAPAEVPTEEAAAPSGPIKIKAEMQDQSVTLKTKDDISGVTEGMAAVGEGIPPNTTVVRAGGGGVVLSAAAIQSGTDVEVTIVQPPG